MALSFWIRSRVCSSAENFLNHRLNRRLFFLSHRFNRCLSLRGTVSALPLEQPPTFTPMATGASDAWRMNRRFSIGSTGATAWSKLPLHSLWTLLLQIHRRPSDVPVPQWRIFRCPSDHVSISFRSGQTYTGGYTDGLLSTPSDLPVLRVGGPASYVFT